MRIIIDTDIQAIIVPDSYYMQVDKLNEVITEAGGKALDYTAYVKTCFDKAYDTQIIRTADVPKVKGTKGKRKATNKAEAKPVEAKKEETTPTPAAVEGEKK